MQYTEEDIVELLKLKNEKCVRMMFDNYYHALCVYALKYLSSLEDAEDVVQNVFISFWENRKGHEFAGSLQAYMFGAVTKASLKVLEKQGRVYFDDIEEHVNSLLEEVAVTDEEEFASLRERLIKEVNQLPEKAREVFNAIALENLSYKQVAERYNISLNTVKTHYSHALKKLRESLGDLLIVALMFA